MHDNLCAVFFYKVVIHKMKVTIKGKSVKKYVQKTIIFIPNAVCMLFYTVGTCLKVVKPTFFKMT